MKDPVNGYVTRAHTMCTDVVESLPVALHVLYVRPRGVEEPHGLEDGVQSLVVIVQLRGKVVDQAVADNLVERGAVEASVLSFRDDWSTEHTILSNVALLTLLLLGGRL